MEEVYAPRHSLISVHSCTQPHLLGTSSESSAVLGPDFRGESDTVLSSGSGERKVGGHEERERVSCQQQTGEWNTAQ